MERDKHQLLRGIAALAVSACVGMSGGLAAQAAPPDSDILYQTPDPSLIQDEPVAVKPPSGFPPLETAVPAANPLTKGRVELGKQLYFDPRMSKNGTVSCATCHNPEKGWTDIGPDLDAVRGLGVEVALDTLPAPSADEPGLTVVTLSLVGDIGTMLAR